MTPPEKASLLKRAEDQLIRFLGWILRSPARGLADMPADSSAEDQRVLARVLSEGEPSTERRRYGDAKLIVTASPIWAQGEIEGAVLIKQSANKLLALQYKTLQRFTILFLAVFVFLSLAILIFSTRLTYRVGRLQRETEQAASSEGRLLKDRIRAGARSSDELGSLTRSISSMLHNLGQYTRYLERLPDTLAHELHNPLNVVNSSLENLQYNHRELTDDKHLQRARNGIGRLRSIITSLTEAASLKEALSQEQEQLERFDLRSLIQNCVEGYQSANPGYRIVATLAPTSTWIFGVPDRIAQMLDKLIDNAIAFGAQNGLIIVNVRHDGDNLELTVSNDGPTLPAEIADSLFDPMVSSTRDARKTHLGLGLYIVRLVTEFHKGTVAARNRRGGTGVDVVVSLPMLTGP
jgi:signal transduction histidine kinase